MTEPHWHDVPLAGLEGLEPIDPEVADDDDDQVPEGFVEVVDLGPSLFDDPADLEAGR